LVRNRIDSRFRGNDVIFESEARNDTSRCVRIAAGVSVCTDTRRHFSRFSVNGKLPPRWVQVPSMLARSELILPAKTPPACFISTLSDDPVLVTDVAGSP